MTEPTIENKPNKELQKTVDELEQEVIEELELEYTREENPNKMFSAVFPYEIYIPITTDNDVLTEIIIRTNSETFFSARNKQDVLFQKEVADEYTDKPIIRRMVKYVSKEINEVPNEKCKLTYTGKIIVKEMDEERLADFTLYEEENTISLNLN